MGRKPGQLLPKTLERQEAIKDILDTPALLPITIRAITYKLWGQRLFLGRDGEPMSMDDSAATVSDIIKRWRRDSACDTDLDGIVDGKVTIENDPATWADPRDFLDDVGDWYDYPVWQDQEKDVEVWSEKSTVGSVILPVLRRYRVRFLHFSGYAGDKPIEDAVKRIAETSRELVVLYIGDHDSAGWNMDRNLDERFCIYFCKHGLGDRLPIPVERVSILKEDLTTLPTLDLEKKSGIPWEPYEKWYRAEGLPLVDGKAQIVELDALSPDILRARLEARIRAHMHKTIFQQSLEHEKEIRERLKTRLTSLRSRWRD